MPLKTLLFPKRSILDKSDTQPRLACKFKFCKNTKQHIKAHNLFYNIYVPSGHAKAWLVLYINHGAYSLSWKPLC